MHKWTRQIGTGSPDKGNGVAVDPKTGSIYITGLTRGGLNENPNAGETDIFLVKYDPAGNIEWIRLLGTEGWDEGNGVAVDPKTGSIYVTGRTSGSLDGNPSAGAFDLFLLKYDSAGNKEWTRQLGTNLADVGNGLTVDPQTGSIYATGYTFGDLDGNPNAGEADLFLVKYDSAGNKEWARQLGTESMDGGSGVAVDPKTSLIYVTGATKGSLDGYMNVGDADLLLVKYNPDGNKEWVHQFGTNRWDSGNGIAVDFQTGSIYITGYTYGGLDENPNSGSFDVFLVKYNSAGNKEWTRQHGTYHLDGGDGIAVDPQTGSIYVTGTTKGNLDGNLNVGSSDPFLVKYNPDGNKEWTRQIGTDRSDEGYGVAVDPKIGSIYITGLTYSSTRDARLGINMGVIYYDIFLSSYD